MVLQNRLDYGFNGYQVPPIPQATRSSTRRRSTFRNRVDDKQTCAFDMLASVAGNFLLGRTPPSSSDCDTSTVKDDCKNVKIENSVENTQLKVEPGFQGNLVFEPGNDLDCMKEDFSLSSGFAPEPMIAENLENKKTKGMGNFICEDDDDSSFGKSPTNSFQTAPCIGGHRIRKILASKNWKVAATYGAERPNIGGYTRKFYFKRRNSYKSPRSQMNIPFKKRKVFDRCYSNCSGGRITQRSSDLAKNGTKRKSYAYGKSALGHQRDSHVKLRIKSFRVPELFIEIPESATVSSLKRTVMEAVTAIIGHGIHVGVLIQGKKVRDDNKTLFHTGISCDNQDDLLRFTLEPHSSQISSPLCHGDSPSTFPCSSTPKPITRHTTNPTLDYRGSDGAWLLETDADLSNSIGSNHEAVPSIAHTSVEKSSTDSKALVPVPAMSVEALAVVPVCQKPKQLEAGPRRIRRPFSVAEVEALVHAVETLGTGRWRDVKLRAFDHVNHRTYVDLKDKWKTLVHTARIAPQQRRGEAVPQQLLDRVLTAQAYWSQQHQPHTCLLLP